MHPNGYQHLKEISGETSYLVNTFFNKPESQVYHQKTERTQKNLAENGGKHVKMKQTTYPQSVLPKN